MKFVCYSEWSQLPDSADALFEQAAKDSIFFSRPWFESVTTATLGDDQTLVLACVQAGDQLMAILPLIKIRANSDKQSAGISLYALKHRYTSHYSLLLKDNEQTEILACLVQGLSQLPLNGLLLEPVADNDSNLNGLKQAMEAVGFSCDYAFRHYNWIYHMQEPSFADYMETRPAKLKNTISRKQRKLDREQGYEIRLFTGNEVPQAMPDYYTVYSASWKATEQNVSFMNDIVAGFSRLGCSRLGILYIKGQPAAAQLWFVYHGKANIFRLSYDETWKKYSPGSILTSFLMEYVIDIDKVKEIDFLTGNEVYKQDWMSERRERFVLCCVNNVKPVGKIKQIVESLKSILKRV